MDQAELEDQGFPGHQPECCYDTGAGSTLPVSAAGLFEIPVQDQQKPPADTAIITDQPVYQTTTAGAIETDTAATTATTAIVPGIGP